MDRVAPSPLADPAGDPSPAAVALTMRLSAAYLLDLLPLILGDLDFTDALIMLAVVQANVWPITRDPAAQAAFAGPQDLPPNDQRRPVSVTAIAGSLGLPYETVRRRVRRLEAQGLCRYTPRGVYVPTEALDTPRHVTSLRAALRLTRSLHERLVAEGCLPALPAAEGHWPTPPVRIVARVVADYFLAMTSELAKRYGNALDGFILMQVIRVNARGHASAAAGGDPILADDLRRPAAVSQVARALGLSHELTRRRMNALIAKGACRRTRGGLIVPQARLESPELREFMGRNYAAIRRMFAILGRLGALV